MRTLFHILNRDHSSDNKAIEDSVKSYYLSTGVNISAIDKNGKEVYSCGKCPEFCDFFKECAQVPHVCYQEHLKGSKVSEHLGEEYVFSCSAGLIHFTAPIVNGKVFCGALIGGPVLMAEPDDLVLEDIMTKNQIPVHAKARLLAYLRGVPVIDPERVRYLSKLMFIVSSSLMPEERFVLREHFEKSKQQSEIGESIHSLKKMMPDHAYYPYDRERELLGKVKNGDIIGAKAILNELLGVIFFHTGGDIEVIKAKILELCTLLSRAAVEGGAALDDIFGMNYRFIGELSKITNLADLSFWILKVLDRFTENIFYIPDSKNSDIIKRAINYINENYNNNITLDAVASVVHLNASYFSGLLKKEIGIGFSDYLNKVRIEKSKELLLDSKDSISEVALLVGFEDQSYYSKVFKKVTGDTPKEFRDKLK